MNERIFLGNGIEITRENGQLFISYDLGDHAGTLRHCEITEAEAARAQSSEADAYQVILAAEARMESEHREKTPRRGF